MDCESVNNDTAGTESERPGWSALRRFVEGQEHGKATLFLEEQARVLELIASSIPRAVVLAELTRILEQQIDGMACTILLATEDGTHLYDGAAPTLPHDFSRALDGLPIGAHATACGLAAHSRQSVIVSNLPADPRVEIDNDLALHFGFKACWSTPILSAQGALLGTLAMYHRRPLAPSPMHLSLLELGAHLARVAIERAADDARNQRLQDANLFADRYRMVLQATGEAVWDLTLDSGRATWHGGWACFGYELGGEEHGVAWWLDRVHPEDVDRVRRGFERAVDSQEFQWEDEYRFRKMDGSYSNVVDRAIIVRDASGKAARMVGSVQDITRRKRHERAMEQLAERFRSATAAAAVGTWRYDLRTKRFLADEALNRMLGGPEEEAILERADVMRAVHPDDRARVGEDIDESIATGRDFQSDHRVVLPDGQVRWLRSRGRVFSDLQGRVEGIIGALADITELKHAEQSMTLLAEASRRLSESLDSEQIMSTLTHMVVPSFSDAAIIHVADPATGELRLAFVHAANPQLQEALDEIRRSPTFRVAAPSHRVMRTGQAELHPRLTPEWLLDQDVDAKMVELIQRYRLSSTIHVPITWAGQPYAVLVFGVTGTRIYNARDLAFADELARRASNAMRNAELFQTATAERERAEEAAALRERLIAIVGHDLRNPLSSIKMAAQILGERDLPSTEKRLASQIVSSTNRMKRIIDQILDFARIRAGHSFALRLEPSDVHQISSAVVDELRLSRLDREIALHLTGDGDATCDPDRIAQVLSNLIGNAIQYGSEGPITVDVRDAASDAVAIAVHNFGPPIPREAQERIFDAFRRESETNGEHHSKSIGLGLFIASEIVQAHGGTLSVRSPDREGTTFTVVLPRHPAPLPVAAEEPLAH